MYVYLRWCDGIKRTPKVSLNLRRCMPVVRTYSEGRIDPALWFKVLVLNSVLIDIDRRKVFWTCKNPDDSSKFRNYHEEQVVETQKFVDFFSTQEEITSISDCDNFEYDTRAAELYGTARGIYTNLSMEVFDKEGNVSTYEDLLKILHVFILPEVKFHLKDRHSIQAVLDQMENECQMVESLINRKMTEKRFYEDSLGRQRKSLIKTGLLLGHLNNINTEEDFYKLLLKHLDKDVKRLEDNIVSLTDRIVHLKKYSSESEHCEYKLQQARETRSKYLKDKEKLLMTKEELFQQTLKHEKDLRKSRTFLRRSKSLPKKKKIVSSYSVYVNESKLLDAVSDEIRSLINSKIKLSGMREAVHLTVSEIDGDGVSYGFNRKHGAFEAEADMFDPRKKPDDWMTLREQVQDFLNSDRSETRTRHDKFCDSVKRKCGKLLAGSHGRCSDGGSLSSSTGSHMSKMSKRYTVRWLHGNVSKEECEKLCMEVSEYILDTAHIMSVEIQGRDTEMITYHTHVYICYEKHVADDIMAELSNVFKESFRDICEQLYAWIATYSMTELEFINKLMSQLFPDDSDRDTKFVNPTGSLPRYTPGFMTGVTENGGNLRGLARISKSLEHLPLSTLVDKLHEQTGNLAITFEKAWSVISSEGDATKSLKSLYKDDKIYSSFSEFFTLIHTEIKTNSIFDKLRHLSRAVQIVESRAQHLFKLNGHKSDMTTDDLLDILILLVCKLDPNSLLCLYADLNLIFHLTPSFLQGSMSQYCVTTLTGAYQHLFERQDLLMASRETNA